MIRHHSADQVKRFDLFKLIVTIILLLLLLFFWLFRPFDSQTGLTQAPAPPATSSAMTTSQAAGESTQATEPAATPTPVEAAVSAPTEANVEVTAPTLNLPTGQALTPGQVALNGTGEPGSEVEVLINGRGMGKALVNSDGQWNLPIELPQAGDYEIKVQAVDATGQVLAESEPASLMIPAAAEEIAAPDEETTLATEEAVTTGEVVVPALDLPDTSLAAGEVTLSGVGEPGSEVEIIINGQSVGQATVDPDGQWTLTTDLPEPGNYEVRVQTIDASGKALAISEPMSLTVTVAAEEMAAPDEETTLATEEAITTGEAVVPALDLPDTSLAAGEVILTGVGEPGSEVEIIIDGQSVGQATVDPAGQWTLTTDLPEPGNYEVRVQTIDASGKALAVSEPMSLTVAAAAEEMAAPDEETTLATEEAVTTGEAVVPALDLPDMSLAAGEVILTGVGEPGSEVEIIIDGQSVGQATVDPAGQWTLTTDLPEPGNYEARVQTIDASGKALAVSEPMSLTVAAATEETASPMQVTTPALDLPEEPLVVGQIPLSGTGEPGSEIEISLNNEVVAKVTVGSDGKWSIPVELTEAKDYTVRVQAVDSEGKVLAVSEPVSLTVTTPAETAAPSTESTSDETGGQAYIVQADDWLSKIALKFYGDINAYSTIIEATNQKAKQDNSFTTITNPDLIEVGQKLWIPE